ncbi:MAG: hypothetical protein ABIB61_01395 [Candidatus Shapirobacteria bacterium]
MKKENKNILILLGLLIALPVVVWVINQATNLRQRATGTRKLAEVYLRDTSSNPSALRESGDVVPFEIRIKPDSSFSLITAGVEIDYPENIIEVSGLGCAETLSREVVNEIDDGLLKISCYYQNSNQSIPFSGGEDFVLARFNATVKEAAEVSQLASVTFNVSRTNIPDISQEVIDDVASDGIPYDLPLAYAPTPQELVCDLRCEDGTQACPSRVQEGRILSFYANISGAGSEIDPYRWMSQYEENDPVLLADEGATTDCANDGLCQVTQDWPAPQGAAGSYLISFSFQIGSEQSGCQHIVEVEDQDGSECQSRDGTCSAASCSEGTTNIGSLDCPTDAPYPVPYTPHCCVEDEDPNIPDQDGSLCLESGGTCSATSCDSGFINAGAMDCPESENDTPEGPYCCVPQGQPTPTPTPGECLAVCEARGCVGRTCREEGCFPLEVDADNGVCSLDRSCCCFNCPPEAPTATPTPDDNLPTVPVSECVCTNDEAGLLRAQGDANCNGQTDLIDYSIWFDIFIRGGAAYGEKGDLNCQNGVTIDDYEIWRSHFDF